MSGKQFSISAIFSATDKISAPARKISESINKIGAVSRLAGSAATSAFDKTSSSANKAGSAIDKLKSKFNFSNQIGKVKDLGKALRSLSSSLAVAGGVGVGAGYTLYRGLGAVRAKEMGVALLGGAFAPGKSLAEREKVGNKEFANTQSMAQQLPGNASEIASFRAMLKQRGVNPNLEVIKHYTDMMSVMGITNISELEQAIRSTLSGNQSDLLERANLKLHTDNGVSFYKELSTGKESKHFKNAKEQEKFLREYAAQHYAGNTQQIMDSVAGKESNLSDTIEKTSAKLAEGSGFVKAYNQQIEILSKIVTKVGEALMPTIKSISEFAQQNKTATAILVIGVPVVLTFSAALIALSVAFGYVGHGIMLSRIFLSKLLILLSGATLPITLLITTLVLGAVAIYRNWEPIKGFFSGVIDTITSKFQVLLDYIERVKSAASSFASDIFPSANGMSLPGQSRIPQLSSGVTGAGTNVPITVNNNIHVDKSGNTTTKTEIKTPHKNSTNVGRATRGTAQRKF